MGLSRPRAKRFAFNVGAFGSQDSEGSVEGGKTEEKAPKGSHGGIDAARAKACVEHLVGSLLKMNITKGSTERVRSIMDLAKYHNVDWERVLTDKEENKKILKQGKK